MVGGQGAAPCRVGASRSQNVRKSEEGPVRGLERRDAGRWMSVDEQRRTFPPPSAFRLFRWRARFGMEGIESAGLDKRSW